MPTSKKIYVNGVEEAKPKKKKKLSIDVDWAAIVRAKQKVKKPPAVDNR